MDIQRCVILDSEDQKLIEKAIREGISKEVVEFCEKFAKELEDFEPTQMYRVFTELNNLYINIGNLDGEEMKRRLLVTRARVAYALARAIDRIRNDAKKKKIRRFKNGIIFGIDVVTGMEKDKIKDVYKNFYSLFESILAYHKACVVEEKIKSK